MSVLDLIATEVSIFLIGYGWEWISSCGEGVVGELIFLLLWRWTNSFIILSMNSGLFPESTFYGVFNLGSNGGASKCKIWVVGIKGRISAIRCRSSDVVLIAMMAIWIERAVCTKMICLFAMIADLQS